MRANHCSAVSHMLVSGSALCFRG